MIFIRISIIIYNCIESAIKYHSIKTKYKVELPNLTLLYNGFEFKL